MFVDYIMFADYLSGIQRDGRGVLEGFVRSGRGTHRHHLRSVPKQPDAAEDRRTGGAIRRCDVKNRYVLSRWNLRGTES